MFMEVADIGKDFVSAKQFFRKLSVVGAGDMCTVEIANFAEDAIGSPD